MVCKLHIIYSNTRCLRQDLSLTRYSLLDCLANTLIRWEIEGPVESIHTKLQTPKKSSSTGPVRTLIDESDHSLNLKE